MNFPHMKDNDFPYIDTVDVYSIKNEFDYTRWDSQSEITLTNVLWNSDYSDVVKFDTDTERDSYFDSKADTYKIVLESECRIIPNQAVKLPLPYDVMAKYNYLFVDIKIATSPDYMIDYEADSGIRRWFFFIDSIEYKAPNCTLVTLIPDVWTNFQNDIEINYMMLERGHAPLAASDVDAYLANPISNNDYVLAPDVDFGKSTIVKNSNFVPFGNGEKYLVFISTISPSNIGSMGAVTNAGQSQWTAPEYSNTTDRFGYQLYVDGYSFGSAGSYSNVKTPCGNGSNDRLANNVFAYGIQASECFSNANFLDTLAKTNPNFLNSTLVTLIVDESMITLGASYSIAGKTFYECRSKENSRVSVNLNKEMFGFPSEFKKFTKLYTYPYSYIELTDNENKKVQIKIEETHGISYQQITSIAFPFLNTRILFSGIGGDGTNTYTWKRINGASVQREIGVGDWKDASFDWAIPTYSIYADGETVANLRGWNGLQNARRDAIVNYHTSVRPANTALNNALDSNSTACSNAISLSAASRQNAQDSASTQRDNAYVDANTLISNMVNTTNTQTGNTNITTTTNTANINLQRDYHNTIADMGIAANDALMDARASTNLACTIANSEQGISAANNTTFSNEVTGAIGGGVGSLGIAAGAVAAGVASGGTAVAIAGGMALVGAISGWYSGQAGQNTAATALGTNVAVAQQQNNLNYYTGYMADGTERNGTFYGNQLNDNLNNNCNNALTAQTRNNTNCETANANNTASEIRGNADRSRNTASNNAVRTDNANASAANDTKATSDNNSYGTRSAAIANAKEILENAQARERAIFQDARNASPTAFGEYSGNFSPDFYENRGIQIKVRTESNGAIRQAGDTFARYGYALNQCWKVDSFKVMRNFSYWKASEIWLDDDAGTTNAVNETIRSIFLNGVTIWSNPDKVGRVSIYDN